MKAVILAAGMGRRLAAMGWDQPKCLLPCPQGTLLDNAITSALTHGVEEIVIVVGFQQELVVAAASRHDAKLTFVVNEHFASTNTLHSLRLTEEHLRDGFLLFNGDVWFQSAVLDRLLAYDGSALGIEPKPCGDEEVKVVVDAEDRIRKIGKKLSPDTCLGEYLGIAKFDADFAAHFAASLRRLDESIQSSNFFYETALDPLLEVNPLRAVRLEPSSAIEIDTPDDRQHALRLWAT